MRSSEYPTPHDVIQARQEERPATIKPKPFTDFFKEGMDELTVAEVPAEEAPTVETTGEVEPDAEAPEVFTYQSQRLREAFEAQSIKQPQEHKPIEMGQVVIQATQTEDTLSEKAFNNAAPDKREHRRASRTAFDANEKPEDIPADVVNEVAAHMKRSDFVKQQEDLFGKNDKIKPEDVPEGEITNKKYLEQRPVAEEGDTYRITNAKGHVTVLDAVTGDFAQKTRHETKLEDSSADEYYAKLETQANRDAVFEEATAENNLVKTGEADVIRSNIEGKFLVEKDARLRGLLSLGKDVRALYDSKLTGEEFEENIKPELEEKNAIYNDLFRLYKSQDIDPRALGYIDHETTAIYDDPSFTAIEGSAFIDGKKVDILDFTETPDGKKAYTIEREDGSIEAVYTDEVTFNREYETYEAPEVEEPEAEVELSRFDRVKKWFGKQGNKFREAAGLDYFNRKWHDANNWLTTHRLDPNETPEGAEARKYINRRHILMGGAAVLALTLVAKYAGMDHGGTGQFVASIFDNTPDTTPDVDVISNVSGDQYASINAIEHAAGQGGEPQFDLAIPGYDASLDLGAMNIDNEAYNIPSGGSITDVFNGVFGDSGVASEKMKQHALELAGQYPDTFYVDPIKGDVRINDSGWLPADVRTTIEGYKNS